MKICVKVDTIGGHAVGHSTLKCLTHRIRRNAAQTKLAHTHAVSAHTSQQPKNPVGDVRGYEGMGRISDECGVSFTIDMSDPVHSRANRLQPHCRASCASSFQPATKRAANALACNATSVTAVLSHHRPRNGGPMANRREDTCPCASTTAPPGSAAIPSAKGPG